MVGQVSARRAAGVILEMIKVHFYLPHHRQQYKDKE